MEAQVPKNTKQKTKTYLDVFKRWMKSALPRDQREIHEIPPNQLNQYLRSFFLTVKKKNGEEYEPESLKGITQTVWTDIFLAKSMDIALLVHILSQSCFFFRICQDK